MRVRDTRRFLFALLCESIQNVFRVKDFLHHLHFLFFPVLAKGLDFDFTLCGFLPDLLVFGFLICFLFLWGSLSFCFYIRITPRRHIYRLERSRWSFLHFYSTVITLKLHHFWFSCHICLLSYSWYSNARPNSCFRVTKINGWWLFML